MTAPDATLEVADRAARERALDVRRSFLVQAPAGSGKTGLLIQRMLALLAIVERPEQVLAMTFTRKAAAEMRERVLRALRDAHDEVPVDAAEPARRSSRANSRARRSRRTGVTAGSCSPIRRACAVVTIDALAAAFARQAPITTGLGALPAFVDDASMHYREAVGSALASAAPDDPHWRTFLLHLDNDAAGRDRSAGRHARPPRPVARAAAWRGRRRARARGSSTRCARKSNPRSCAWRRWCRPRSHASSRDSKRSPRRHFADEGADPERAAFLQALAERGGVPAANCASIELWDALAQLAARERWPALSQRLEQDERLPGQREGRGCRRTGTRGAGDPRVVRGRGGGAGLRGRAARRALAATVALWRTGVVVRRGNARAAADARVANCSSCSRARGETDFSEATLRALAALGNADAPEDLLLAADLRIAHILVDEFQDTSWTQLELVGRLTSGWDDRRRPHAVRRRRSDAVDLPVPRSRGAQFPRRAGGRAHQRRAGRVPRRCRATSGRCGRSSTGSTRCFRTCSRRPRMRRAATSRTRRCSRRATRPARRRRPSSSCADAASRGAGGRAARARRAAGGRGGHRDPRARARAPRRDPAGAARGRDRVRGRGPRVAGRAAAHARPDDAHARADAAARPHRGARPPARAVVRTRAGRPAVRRAGRVHAAGPAGDRRCRDDRAGERRRPRAPRAAARGAGARDRGTGTRVARVARARGVAGAGRPRVRRRPARPRRRRSATSRCSRGTSHGGDLPDWPAFAAVAGKLFAQRHGRRDARRAGDDAAQGEGSRIRHGDPARARARHPPRRRSAVALGIAGRGGRRAHAAARTAAGAGRRAQRCRIRSMRT